MELFKRNIFESCFVHRVKGKPADADHWNSAEKMNLTSQALVGIIINKHSEKIDFWPAPKSMHKKLTIFICDEDFDIDKESERLFQQDKLLYVTKILLSCKSTDIKKCSRMIFVNSNGGKGIHFLNGHGILLSVRNIANVPYAS